MNESKSNVPNMYQAIPAVAALNRVPGFEPMKLLRRTKSRKSNEIVLKLALPYKKLWFRLAHPKGRIMVNRLKITEQMAIYEAQVYLDRSDTEPISCFTASCVRNDAEKNDYIKEAQEEAIDEALSIAGFGLQFADVEMTKEAERFGSEVPLSVLSTPSAKVTTHIPVTEPTKEIMKVQEPVQEKLPIETVEENELPIHPADAAEQENIKLPVESVQDNVQEEKQANKEVKQIQPAQAEQDKLSAAQRAMQILQRKAPVNNGNSVTPSVEAKIEQTEVEPPKYTRSTPVPEILQLMTFEEAQNVVVDYGTCNGKTIQEVADTRPANLKFYLFGGYKGGNNILLAAARIMYDYLEAQRMEKAG